MFVPSNEKNYLFLCLCLFVDYWKKKKKELGTRVGVPYKELELGKLEFHRSTKQSIYHVSTGFYLFMKLKYLKLDLHNKLEFQKSSILLRILQTVLCC